jgi:hypothetical protein
MFSSTNPKDYSTLSAWLAICRFKRKPRSPMPSQQAAGVSLVFSRCGINDREYIYTLLVVAFLDCSYTVTH